MDKPEKEAKIAIRKGDIKSLSSYLEDHPDANCKFSDGKTGLYYAIEYDQFEICEFLLKRGADPDLMVDGFATLMWAVIKERPRIIRILIEYGADVNKQDDTGDTPLIHATELKNQEICKILIDRGANPFQTNLKTKRAIDYTGYDAASPVFQYLSWMENLYRARDSLPSMHDGPYISWENEGRMVMTYYEHDQAKHLTRLIEKTIEVKNNDTTIGGIGWDKRSYDVMRHFTPDPCSVETSGKIMVLGDIHGKYRAMVNFLQNNKVIDPDLNWIFGDGQLVFLGDIFDRGASVTEALWFLYELQMQARSSGGNVHLLLGNHEVMALTGDHRYLNGKYAFFSQYTLTPYSQLYDTNTVLGRWLRSLNVITGINGNILVHAGISPQFAIHDYSFEEINSRVQRYLYSDYCFEKGSPEDFILGGIGPQWYRGYGDYDCKFPELNQEFIDSYLSSKGFERMILGHNEQPAITTSFEGKVISTDVEIDENGISSQGLLISGDELYICYADGTRERLE